MSPQTPNPKVNPLGMSLQQDLLTLPKFSSCNYGHIPRPVTTSCAMGATMHGATNQVLWPNQVNDHGVELDSIGNCSS